MDDTAETRRRDALAQFAATPLVSAILNRRSRRFGLGMEIPDGPLAYRSRREPVPLDDLERGLLVLLGCGLSGWNTGIEHVAAGAEGGGGACNYPIRLGGRSFATGAASGAAEMIVSDDAGTFITQFRDIDPDAMRRYADVTDLPRLIGQGADDCVRLFDGRVQVPRAAPHMSSHNFWNANQPGSTLFVPVVDQTQRLLNRLFIYVERGVAPFDTRQQRDCGDMGAFERAGVIRPGARFPLEAFEQNTFGGSVAEQAIMCQNMVLAMEAMGLGGWMYTGISPESLLGTHAEAGIPGLGFTFTRDARCPAPNPVGIAGVFEALCPPFHGDMAAAVDHFVALKFDRGGTYDDERGGPWRDTPAVKAATRPYRPAIIDCVKAIAADIHDTYGRFPGTVPSMAVQLIVQAHHLDTDFYDRMYQPGAYGDAHAEHMRRWHGL